MKNKINTLLFTLTLLCISSINFAQESHSKDPDIELKESLYKKFKNEVRSFDKRKFDDLFLEFFQKSADNNTNFTKEEYYTYTIKIAIYSEKLGLLYKDQKEEAQKAKQDWFDKKYTDYLNSKKTYS